MSATVIEIRGLNPHQREVGDGYLLLFRLVAEQLVTLRESADSATASEDIGRLVGAVSCIRSARVVLETLRQENWLEIEAVKATLRARGHSQRDHGGWELRMQRGWAMELRRVIGQVDDLLAEVRRVLKREQAAQRMRRMRARAELPVLAVREIDFSIDVDGAGPTWQGVPTTLDVVLCLADDEERFRQMGYYERG